MKSWITGTKNLNALIDAAPKEAERYFGTPQSFALGAPPPAGWTTTWAGYHKSVTTFALSKAAAKWVMYAPENWDETPLKQQEHPAAYMDAFCIFAHAAGKKVILAPARNLVSVSSGDSVRMPGDSMDDAYLRARIPENGGCAEIFACQSQANQKDPVAYAQLIRNVKAQLPSGHWLWAGLTTMRGDKVQAMVDCWEAVEDLVNGFWLNADAGTIGVAAEFLKVIHP
jgi:hypothetical protein